MAAAARRGASLLDAALASFLAGRANAAANVPGFFWSRCDRRARSAPAIVRLLGIVLGRIRDRAREGKARGVLSVSLTMRGEDNVQRDVLDGMCECDASRKLPPARFPVKSVLSGFDLCDEIARSPPQGHRPAALTLTLTLCQRVHGGGNAVGAGRKHGVNQSWGDVVVLTTCSITDAKREGGVGPSIGRLFASAEFRRLVERVESDHEEIAGKLSSLQESRRRALSGCASRTERILLAARRRTKEMLRMLQHLENVHFAEGCAWCDAVHESGTFRRNHHTRVLPRVLHA